ncbi:MAG: putative toxin-antitoxin system toxin component, PIN family [Saprospiraceae bacterium]
MNDVLRVVLDTNIIISSLSLKSPYRAIIDCFLEGKFNLFLSNEIMAEYEEKIRERYDQTTADLFLDALSISLNVYQIETFYKLRLIYPDMDDNKFVDCAFAANAHVLVTNDRDFNVLKTIEFPKINIMRLETFLKFISTV